MPLPSGTHFPVQVISTIKPVNGAGFPVVSDTDIEGGYQVHETLTDRDNIPENNRKEGMLVYVKAEDFFYTLSGGITNANWVIKIFAETKYDLTGSSDETTLGRVNNFSVGNINSPNGYLASVPAHTNSHLFKDTVKICTDGAHIWSASNTSVEADKANFIKTVLVDYGASYALNYSSNLDGTFNGTACAANQAFSPYVFLCNSDSEKILIIEKATDAVIGIAEYGAQRFSNLSIDIDGYLFGTNFTHGNQISKFNTQTIIDNYPTPTPPTISIATFNMGADLFYDGYSMWTVGGSFIERIEAATMTHLGTYDASVDFPGLAYTGVCVVNGFVFAISEDQIHRFNIASFEDGPTLTQSVFRGLFGKITFSNNFLWITNSGNGELHQVNMTLNEVNFYEAPVLSINSCLALAKNPFFNEIYIGFSGSDANGTGVFTFNTETLTYNTKRFYRQAQRAQIKSIPASCVNANKPENPFTGQMVFVTDLGPGIPQWWNGTSWVDATGSD